MKLLIKARRLRPSRSAWPPYAVLHGASSLSSAPRARAPRRGMRAKQARARGPWQAWSKRCLGPAVPQQAGAATRLYLHLFAEAARCPFVPPLAASILQLPRVCLSSRVRRARVTWRAGLRLGGAALRSPDSQLPRSHKGLKAEHFAPVLAQCTEAAAPTPATSPSLLVRVVLRGRPLRAPA